MFEKTEGIAQKLAGHVQEAVGAVTGNESARYEGKARRAAGEVQQNYGELLNQLRESAVTHPLATVAAVAATGFVLGALWARR